ncbi:MAG TPA: MFS transporter [Anaerolineales bacterium]|nr:MFS transporter [Anaerolineales bacterium]
MTSLFRSSWVWLLVLYTIASFLETVFWGQMAAFTPIFLANLGMAQSQIPQMVGIIAAIVGAAGIPFLPFWGALADRYSRQPLVVRSFFIYLLAGMTSVLAGNVWIFVLGRSLMSLSLGNTGLMLTTLAERTPSDRQGFAFAVMSSASPVGAFVGPLIGGPVVDHWGFRTLMWVDVALMISVVLSLTFGYFDSYRGKSRDSIWHMAGDSIRVSFQAGRLRTIFVAFFLLYAGWMIVFSYLPVVISSLYQGNDPASAIGYVLGAGGVMAMILSPLFGSMADRLGHWRVLMIGAALETILWLVPFWTRSLIPFSIIICIVGGIASAVFSISFNVLSSSASVSIRGRVMSFAYLPVNVGYSFGPLLASQLVRLDLFYIFPMAFLFTGLGLLVLNIARQQPAPSDM